MKFDNPAHPLRSRRKEGGPKMQCAGFLAKARTGNHTDACLVEELETVEFIRSAVLVGGGFYGTWWEVDCGEEVHGSLKAQSKQGRQFRERRV